MPRRDDAPRDLLFGLLALQNGMVSRDQLVMAFTAWTGSDRPIADILVEHGALSPPRRDLLDALAAEHLVAHGGDPEKSLAALDVNRSTRESLANAGGPEVEATLAHVGSGSGTDDDADRTSTYAVGTATADGQRFRVLRPHARGGLGAVFVALDAELNREVAIKQILDHHADDPVSRQRFLLEAEITGGLEHPGVVPVYGLGHYADGRPYYAMRFIRGNSLKEAIERFHKDESPKPDPGRRSLELRKLLRRFLDVCNAVDYAHSRGVLHRDIKPGNIIVGRHGETLLVDWGLAKATGRADPASGERTLVPSSASGSAETLPGSALGTPAYMSPEQATGQLERLGPRSDVYSLGATLYCLLTGKPPFEGGVADVLRAVQKGEVPSPRRRDPSLDRALEAVCLRAMSLQLEDRYTSCRALSEDIERWMADEPVSAYSEPPLVRLGRWTRRHKTPVTVVAALLLATLAALAVGNVLLRTANRRTEKQRVLAVANASEAQRQRKAAEDNLKTAEENYALAREAVNRYLTRVSEDRLLNEPHMIDLRGELLGQAREFYQAFVERRRDDPNARHDLALAQYRLGEINWHTGQVQAAIKEIESSRSTLEQSLKANPQGVKERSTLARTLTLLGWRYEQTGRIDASERTLKEAVEVAEALQREKPDDPERRASLAFALERLGGTYAGSRRPDDAERVQRQAVTLLEALVKEFPENQAYASTLSACYADLGVLCFDRLENEASLDWHRKSLALRRALAQRGGKAVNPRHALALAWNNVATVNRRLGRLDDAISESLAAIEIFREVIREHPTITTIQNDLATTLSNLAIVYNVGGRNEKAHEVNREAFAIQERMVAEHPERLSFRERLGAAQGNEGNTWLDQRNFAEALAWYDRSITTLDEVLKREPRSTAARSVLRNNHWGRADALMGLNRTAEALPAFDKAVELTDENHRPEVRLCRAVALARSGDHAGAVAVVDAETGVVSPQRLVWFECARVFAQAAVAVRGEMTLGAERRRAIAEGLESRAVALLRRAAASNYFMNAKARDRVYRDPDLNPLRSRPDFQLLRMDLDFPIKPFAR
jgi:serine/threonine-protein kinase